MLPTIALSIDGKVEGEGGDEYKREEGKEGADTVPVYPRDEKKGKKLHIIIVKMATSNKTHNCIIILSIQKKKLKGNLHKLETLFNKEKFLFVL